MGTRNAYGMDVNKNKLVIVGDLFLWPQLHAFRLYGGINCMLSFLASCVFAGPLLNPELV